MPFLLVQSLTGLDSFFCESDAQLAALEFMAVNGVNGFLSNIVCFEDDKGMPLESPVEVSS
jgi:hypothetical protein